MASRPDQAATAPSRPLLRLPSLEKPMKPQSSQGGLAFYSTQAIRSDSMTVVTDVSVAAAKRGEKGVSYFRSDVVPSPFLDQRIQEKRNI